jgi:hypothetical protein
MSFSKKGAAVEESKGNAKVEVEPEPEPGKVDTKALEKELTEKGVSYAQFSNAEEGWRKRALNFGTPDSKYEEMKLKYKWLYDQPIKSEEVV